MYTSSLLPECVCVLCLCLRVCFVCAHACVCTRVHIKFCVIAILVVLHVSALFSSSNLYCQSCTFSYLTELGFCDYDVRTEENQGTHEWPESELNTTVSVPCYCGPRNATRSCNLTAMDWDQPDVTLCLMVTDITCDIEQLGDVCFVYVCPFSV